MRSSSSWRHLILFLGDAALFGLSLLLAIAIRQHHLSLPHISAAFFPIFLSWTCVFYGLGLYDLRQLRDLVSVIRNFLPAAAINWALGATFFYFTSPYNELTPKTILFLTILFSHAGAFVWRRGWLLFLRSQMVVQKVAFLADENRTRDLRTELAIHPQMGYKPVPQDSPDADVVIAHAGWIEQNWERGLALFNDALRRGVPVITLEDFYETLFGKILPENAREPKWLMDFALPQGGSGAGLGKRLFDVVVALALGIALAPVWILTAIALALFEKGPAFYGQKRLGYLGKEFTLRKFRTMIVDADLDGAFTAMKESDDRVTPIGRFLRRSRIDELPQLWNVLRGEMSIVGPRPEWIKEIEVIEKELPEYHLRHLVRPGITGWAQVHFRATDSLEDSMEKLRFDLYYLKNYSMALDLSILLKTVKRVFISDQLISQTKRIDRGLDPKAMSRVRFGRLVGRN